MAQDTLAEILDNLSQSLLNLDQSFYVVAAIMGLAFIGWGLITLKRSAISPQPLTPALISILLGTLLFSLQTLVDAASISLFEQEASLTRELTLNSDLNLLKPYIRFAVIVVVILGIY
ncbi:MAG: hypothetical protein IJU40_02095, partial [Desulfovibrionaceae bacterium]|nr:hypothetical protein [Desulfovibrionaceae bacterium]